MEKLEKENADDRKRHADELAKAKEENRKEAEAAEQKRAEAKLEEEKARLDATIKEKEAEA
jgi:hypothetical protein